MLTLLANACHESSDPPMPEPEGVNSASVLITADPTQQSIELTYEFEPALTEFWFHYQADRIRDGSWEVLNREFVLESGSVRRIDGGLIESVRLRARIDAGWFDRVFPALQAVGNDGLVFNTDYLTLEEIRLDSIRARVAPGHVVAYSNFISVANDEDVSDHALPVDPWHFVYFGREELIRTFSGSVIVSDVASTSRMLERLRIGVEPAVEWLGLFLGIDSVERVHVIATVDEASENTSWRGDVSDSGEIFLRFLGSGWLGEHEDLARIAERSFHHELVHALTSLGFQVRDGEPEWLWEGLAEYLALVYTSLHGFSGDADWFRAGIQERTSECINTLEQEGVGISHPAMLRGSAPYNCGVLVYWLLDGAPATQGTGDRLRDVWSSVTESFAAANPEYGVADLLSAAGSIGAVEAQALFELLVQGPGGSDWQDLDRLLSELGVLVTYEYDDAWDARARSAVVDHILSLQCMPGRMGFWTFEDHIRLDTGDRCGPLSGDPFVDRINELSVFGDMQTVFDSVEAACSNGEAVQFEIFDSSESLTVECAAPIRKLPPSARLTVGNPN